MSKLDSIYLEKNYPTKNSSKEEIREFIKSIPPNTKITRGGLKMVLRKKSDMKKKSK